MEVRYRNAQDEAPPRPAKTGSSLSSDKRTGYHNIMPLCNLDSKPKTKNISDLSRKHETTKTRNFLFFFVLLIFRVFVITF
jgi:hypothetical protein